MKTPQFLNKGDKVGIIATARKISKAEILPAAELLTKWGLEVVFGKHLFNENNQFAGTDKERAFDLQAMLDDDTVNAIIIARGGYGTVRIIDKIDFTNFIKKPKWIVGYSDVTVLHSHVHTLNIETIHATMPINFFKNEQATESLYSALFGKKLMYNVSPSSLNRLGQTQATLVGGNLSLIYSLMGDGKPARTASFRACYPSTTCHAP